MRFNQIPVIAEILFVFQNREMKAHSLGYSLFHHAYFLSEMLSSDEYLVLYISSTDTFLILSYIFDAAKIFDTYAYVCIG